MTPSEFAQILRKKIDQLRSDNRPLNVAAATVHSVMCNRIFRDGKAADGGSIGQYSTKDIWIDPDITPTKNSNGFNPLTGKTGNTQFKTNPSRQRKTSYFKGWKGYRETQGLPVSSVNLNNTGDMFFSLAKERKPILDRVERINISEYVSAFSEEPTDQRQKASIIKARGNEERFGKKIFELSTFERDLFYSTLEGELRQALEIGGDEPPPGAAAIAI